MAGIDNNTVLYLRGDSFTDLSLSPKNITNNGLIISDNSIFSKSLDFTIAKNATVILPTFLDKPFTVEWYEYDTGVNQGNTSIFTNVINASGNNGFGILCLGTGKRTVINLSSSSASWDICQDKPIGNDILNKWVHRCLVYDGDKVISYENGKKYCELNLNGKKILSSYNTFQFNRWRNSELSSGKYIENYRISNIARYTEDFTPPTQPYNSINITITNKDSSKIDFNISKLGQEVVNKVEVLVNNVVSKTYNNIGDLTYNIDNNLCCIGNNNIIIRVTYDDNYTEEEILTHTVTVDNLPTTSSLKDVMDRQELLNSSIEVQKNNLKNILISKNLEITEDENKLSVLIPRVSELGEIAPPLYLYNEGDECIDITGGLVVKHNHNGEYTKNSNYIYLYGNSSLSGGYLTLSTSNKIDLTKYSKIKILADILSVSTTGRFEVYIKNSFGSYPWDNIVSSSAFKTVINSQILELDISTLNSIYYVCFGANAGSSGSGSVKVNIHKIWLEV